MWHLLHSGCPFPSLLRLKARLEQKRKGKDAFQDGDINKLGFGESRNLNNQEMVRNIGKKSEFSENRTNNMT